MSLKQKIRLSKFNPLNSRKLTKEHKKKLSLANKGNVSWSKGLTKETDKRLLKISKKMKMFMLKSNPFKGKKLSKGHRKKISIAHLGIKTWSDNLTKENDLRILKYYSIGRVGKKNPNWKNKTKEIPCAYCKKLNRKRLYCVKKDKKYFCNKECFHKYNRRENNGNWHNGTSFLPYGYGFGKYLKDFIRKRDEYTCQNEECGICLKNNIGKLYTHHIDSNKNNNKLVNLILLCNRCHAKTGGTKNNRKFWKKYYQQIQINRKISKLNKLYKY